MGKTVQWGGPDDGRKTPNSNKGLSFIVALSTTALYHREPASTRTSHDGCGVWGINTRNTP